MGRPSIAMRVPPPGRLGFRAAIGAVLALIGLGATARAQGTLAVAQPDATRFPAVRLYLSPQGAGSEAITTLRREQVVVREDGRPAEVLEVVGGGRSALAVCLAIDRSESMLEENKIGHAREAARLFLAALRPGDRAAIVSFADTCALHRELTADREGLLAAVDALAAGGQTSLYDGIYWAIRQVGLSEGGDGLLSAAPERLDARRAVLVLTDGHDTVSRSTPEEVVRLARRHGVTLYVIGLGADVIRALLLRLAAQTGGECYFAPSPSDLATIYRRMAARFQTEYRVTFRSPRPERDGSRREVWVSIGGSALPPATTWYFAPVAGSVIGLPSSPGEIGAPVAAGEGGPSFPGVALAALAGAALLVGGWFCWRLRPLLAREPPPLYCSGPVTRIGRGDGVEVRLEHPLVSRRHARIEATADGFRLVDEGSRNGTFVNGRRVREALLRRGDRVAFARCVFRFLGEPPAVESADSPEPTLLAAPASAVVPEAPTGSSEEPPRCE